MKSEKTFRERIYSIIEYAEKEEVCRSRILLIYFGENNASDCGNCDVCLDKNETGLSNYEFHKLENAIIHALREISPLRVHELIASLKLEDSENKKLLSVIRFLVDTGDLMLKDDFISITEV